MIQALNLFGAPGGTCLGFKALGIDPLGVEIDDAACATRASAGLRTVQGDVAELDPLDFAPCDVCAASAPCPTFSAAGNGGGRHLTDLITRCMHELAAGNDTRAEHRDDAYVLLKPIYEDREQEKARRKKRAPDFDKAKERARRDADMSLLVVEPLRWVLALKPRFIALEQVPGVLGIWSEMAAILGALGYSTWTGVLSAEQYGVPQTRMRAILMADREGVVSPPAPTHQRYVVPRRRTDDEIDALFDAPEAERIVLPEDRGLLPWVSMVEALGWGMAARPSVTVASGGERYGAKSLGGGSGSQATINAERDRGAWVMEKTEDRPERKAQGAGNRPRSLGEPAATIDTRTDLTRWCATNANTRKGEAPHRHRPNGVEFDPESRPAPTVDQTVARWTHERPAPTIVTTRRSKDGILVGRQLPEGEGENVGGHNWPMNRQWGGDGPQPDESPATIVAGDPRLSSRSHHNEGEQNAHAIRVTLEEAAILQSFPPDYPFQGSKSQRFLQVGNAVPPLLAEAIISALLAPVLSKAPTEEMAT